MLYKALRNAIVIWSIDNKAMSLEPSVAGVVIAKYNYDSDTHQFICILMLTSIM